MTKVTKQPSAPVWPTKVSSEYAKHRLSQYRELSSWKKLLCCAVCARATIRFKMFNLALDSQKTASDLYAGFELLRLTTPMMHYENPTFYYTHPALGHMMLCQDGASNPDSQTDVTLNLCSDCKNSLKDAKMPRHALMNRNLLIEMQRLMLEKADPTKLLFSTTSVNTSK